MSADAKEIGPCMLVSGFDDNCDIKGVEATIYKNIKDIKVGSIATFASPWDLKILRLPDPSAHVAELPKIYLQRNTNSGKVRIIAIIPASSSKENLRLRALVEKYLNGNADFIKEGLQALGDKVYLRKITALEQEMAVLMQRKEELEDQIRKIFP